MKFCTKCGKELEEGALFCANCGAEVAAEAAEPVVEPIAPVEAQNTYEKPEAPKDGKSFGFALLGFFFPLIGLILWLVWKDSMPLRAKSCGKGALIGVIVSVVLSILSTVLLGALMATTY